MRTTYLLPCSCGQKVPVEPRQAGEVVRCSCGASLPVPTMLEMAALQRAQPEPGQPQPQRVWGPRQSVILLGAVISVIALGLGAFLLVTQPQRPGRLTPPTAEEIRRNTQAFSPAQSVGVWQVFRAGGLLRSEAHEGKYRKQLFVWRLWMGVVLTIEVVGVALILTPLLTGRRRGTDSAGRAGQTEHPGQSSD